MKVRLTIDGDMDRPNFVVVYHRKKSWQPYLLTFTRVTFKLTDPKAQPSQRKGFL